MGQMKWIYTMVEDGSYQVFKLMYETALKNGVNSFIFDNREFDIITAKHICILGDKAEKEYEEYIEKLADNYDIYEN